MCALVCTVARVRFTFRLGFYVGWGWPAALTAYFFSSLFLLRFLWKDLQALSREGSELDAAFKRVHARLKMCSESIAFFGGGPREQIFIEERFDAVMTHDWKIQWLNFKFGAIEHIFQIRVPEVLKMCLRYYFAVKFGGTDAEIMADQGQDLNSGQQFLLTAQVRAVSRTSALAGIRTSPAVAAHCPLFLLTALVGGDLREPWLTDRAQSEVL